MYPRTQGTWKIPTEWLIIPGILSKWTGDRLQAILFCLCFSCLLIGCSVIVYEFFGRYLSIVKYISFAAAAVFMFIIVLLKYIGDGLQAILFGLGDSFLFTGCLILVYECFNWLFVKCIFFAGAVFVIIWILTQWIGQTRQATLLQARLMLRHSLSFLSIGCSIFLYVFFGWLIWLAAAAVFMFIWISTKWTGDRLQAILFSLCVSCLLIGCSVFVFEFFGWFLSSVKYYIFFAAAAVFMFIMFLYDKFLYDCSRTSARQSYNHPPPRASGQSCPEDISSPERPMPELEPGHPLVEGLRDLRQGIVQDLAPAERPMPELEPGHPLVEGLRDLRERILEDRTLATAERPMPELEPRHPIAEELKKVLKDLDLATAYRNGRSESSQPEHMRRRMPLGEYAERRYE